MNSVSKLQFISINSCCIVSVLSIVIGHGWCYTGSVHAGELAKPDAGIMVVVQGAGGTEQFEKDFTAASQKWIEIGESLKMNVTRIGDQTESIDRDELKKAIETVKPSDDSALWIVMIGHGTAYRNVAKFNLQGPDVSATDLKDWLKPINRKIVLINCSSSSAPFMKTLALPNRIIVTATKSAAELNYSRFSTYLSLAIHDLKSDLDHDDQVSLLEAFLSASKQVELFYESESRLATEQALLDDNGDGLGTPATFFKGILAVQTAQGGKALDGRHAHQMILVKDLNQPKLTAEQKQRRSELELSIEQLRSRKSKLDEDTYYRRLEELLVELSRLTAS